MSSGGGGVGSRRCPARVVVAGVGGVVVGVARALLGGKVKIQIQVCEVAIAGVEKRRSGILRTEAARVGAALYSAARRVAMNSSRY